MRSRSLDWIAVAALVAMMWFPTAERLLAQGGTQDAGASVPAPAPRTADGQVDFSGLWSSGVGRKLIWVWLFFVERFFAYS